jgi:hypothetical protein
LRVDEMKSVPCMDCGGSFPPWVMDFDHVRGEKIGNVSALLNNGCGWEKIKQEIDKCDIVCSNCHRMRTYSRLHEGDAV